jgi:hypothetical protein
VQQISLCERSLVSPSLVRVDDGKAFLGSVVISQKYAGVLWKAAATGSAQDAPRFNMLELSVGLAKKFAFVAAASDHWPDASEHSPVASLAAWSVGDAF